MDSEKFFDAWGSADLHLHDPEGRIYLEAFYQRFKDRLIRELAQEGRLLEKV